jgi:aryl-alcohol dehydrogenase-like predicted oxidoreductase
MFPRFAAENRKANRELVDEVSKIALQHGVSNAQIALAWILAQKPWIVPIRGTTKLHRLKENIGATTVGLTSEDFGKIGAALAKIKLVGERYPESIRDRQGR